MRQTDADRISEDAQVRQQLGMEHHEDDGDDDEEVNDVDEDVNDEDGDVDVDDEGLTGAKHPQ